MYDSPQNDYCSIIVADFEKFISDRQTYDIESDLKDLVTQIFPGSVFTPDRFFILQDKVPSYSGAKISW